MSLPSTLPLSVCVRERERERVGKREEREPAIISVCVCVHMNYVAELYTDTHTRARFQVEVTSCVFVVSINCLSKSKIDTVAPLFCTTFHPFSHFFLLYLSTAALFPPSLLGIAVLIRCQVRVLADAARGKLASAGQTRPQVALSGILPSQIGVIW